MFKRAIFIIHLYCSEILLSNSKFHIGGCDSSTNKVLIYHMIHIACNSGYQFHLSLLFFFFFLFLLLFFFFLYPLSLFPFFANETLTKNNKRKTIIVNTNEKSLKRLISILLSLKCIIPIHNPTDLFFLYLPLRLFLQLFFPFEALLRCFFTGKPLLLFKLPE